MLGPQVLLIGKRTRIIMKLAKALEMEGFSASWTNKAGRALLEFPDHHFDLIAFGRGVDIRTMGRLQEGFEARNPNVIFMQGIAPIVPLLVEQISAKLLEREGYGVIADALFSLRKKHWEIEVALTQHSRLQVVMYRMDIFFRAHQQILFDGMKDRGRYMFTARKRRGRHYFMIKANDNETLIKAIRKKDVNSEEEEA